MKTNKWHNLYDESWKGLIVPEAFAHPAKMAYGLTRKIFKHALSEGWIKAGDVVCDPFGGIGSTGIVGAHFGLQVVCVELEKKFAVLAQQNFELHKKSIAAFPQFSHALYPVIIQGDSRKLSEIIGSCDLLVSSPPFIQSEGGKNAGLAKSDSPCRKGRRAIPYGFGNQSQVGQTPGQLGAMKPGSIDAVIASPPYAELPVGGNDVEATHRRLKKLAAEGKVGPRSISYAKSGKYAKSGNLARPDYGSTPGNLGNLKPGQVDAIVSSPPYEKSIQTNGDGIDWSKIKEGGTRKTEARAAIGKGYGNTKGQLADEQGETFWQAAKQIVSECHKILKPGGYAIWVVKAFVRNKKIVDFPGDWRKICESIGFETVHEHHAMLVKEDRKQSLFGHEIVKVKERKSFFRRLAEKKGSPKIDYETVLCMRKQ